jgi:hypothetical protein
MDVYDASPFGTPERRPDPVEAVADSMFPPLERFQTVFPWRSVEQPDLKRLTTAPHVDVDRLLDTNGRMPQYQVVHIARDIQDESHYSITAQANIDARNALAVILPGMFCQ